MSLSLKWSTGNAKLRKTRTVSFNLPAFRSADGFVVCPQSGWCRKVCYARQGRHMFRDAVAARELNLAVVRTSLELFERLAVADLERIKARTIRVHDSGDFFSQDYLSTWFRIIAKFPAKRFYCYSKSLHLDWSGKPANFQRVQSVGGLLDAQIDRRQSHARIFATHEDRKRAGYVNGNTNDKPAMRGERKIGLVYHGAANLKRGQILYLRRTE